MEVFSFLFVAVTVGMTILWLVIGWKAMKAHERIADALERLARYERPSASGSPLECGSCGMSLRPGATKCHFCGWDAQSGVSGVGKA